MRQVNFEDPYRIMLFGEPGAGKSVLAASAKAPCHFSIDRGGWESLLNHPWSKEVRSLIPGDYSDVKKFAAAVGSGRLETLYRRTYPDFEGSFQTAIFDSFSAARDMEIREQLGTSDKTSRDTWTMNNRRLNRILEEMWDGPYNVIVICHVKEDKDNDGTTVLTRPDISGGLTAQVLRHLSGVFYLKKTGTSRILQVQPSSQKVTAKNRYGGLPDELVNPSWTKVEDAITKWRANHAETTTRHEPGGDSGEDLPADDRVSDVPGAERGTE